MLIIDDGRVRLEAAEDLRGATCQVTETTLKARLGADYQIASIGPAGEHAVRYATISHDGRHAGRGGSGAVLGSKNVKAIAVRGTQRCEWAHPRELTEYSKNLSKRSFGPATAKYRELGTATNLLTFNRLGALPTRNFQSGTFEGAASISPEQIPHHPQPDARELRRLHHRVRAHLLARRRERRPPGVREPVCAGFAVRRGRPGCRAPRVQVVRRAGHRHDQRGRHDRLRHGVRRTRMARRALAHVRERRRDAARDRARGPPRGPREPAGRGQPPRGRDDRAPQHRVRAAGQGPRDSRLRTESAADDGPGLRRGRPRRRPQPQRRLRGRFLGEGGSPARDAGCGALCHRNRGQGRAHGLAHHLQVPSRRVRGFLRRGRRHAAARHRLGHDRRRTARDGQAHRRHQAAIQSAGRLDAGRRHAARAVSQHAAAERSHGGAQPRAARGLVAEYHRQRGW